MLSSPQLEYNVNPISSRRNVTTRIRRASRKSFFSKVSRQFPCVSRLQFDRSIPSCKDAGTSLGIDRFDGAAATARTLPRFIVFVHKYRRAYYYRSSGCSAYANARERFKNGIYTIHNVLIPKAVSQARQNYTISKCRQGIEYVLRITHPLVTYARVLIIIKPVQR